MNTKIPHGIVEAISVLFSILKIEATVDYINKTLKAHPDFPSLLSISESLSEWKIRTEAVKGTVDDLSEIDAPSIIYLNDDQYAVLEFINADNVGIIFSDKKRKTLAKKNFATLWSGIVLRVFSEECVGESDYRTHKINQSLRRIRSVITFPGLLIFMTCAFAYAILVFVNDMRETIPLAMLKIIGFSMCAVMFSGYHLKSDLLDRFCPENNVSSCQKVMDSKAGKIFGISMVDSGLFYFSCGFLVLFFSVISGAITTGLFFLSVFSLLALPYTLFSVFYQAFVVRSWCWMCLLVQALLWGEFTILSGGLFSGSYLPSTSSLTWSSLFPVLFGFGLSILISIGLIPLLKRLPILNEKEAELERQKTNPEFIQLILKKSKKTDMKFSPVEIEIGPDGNSVKLTQVINPFCNHCGDTFVSMMRLIEVARISGVKYKWNYSIQGQ